MPKMNNSKLILGTVQMGLPYGINNTKGKVSLNESLEILNYAYQNGIEILDTAEVYGNAHQIIGEFHKKYASKKFQIITKLSNQVKGDIIKKVTSFLDELRVGQLHALLFHSFSSFENNQNNFGALEQLKFEKKIKNIGVSVYTNEEIEKVILNKEIDIVQVPFNLLDNANIRGEILAKARSKGKTVHTRSALLQGLFFKDINDHHKAVKNLRNELILIADISKKYKIATSALALGYCMQQHTIDNVLIGVDSIQQLKKNLESVNYIIGPVVIDEINAIHVKDTNLLNPSLWN